MLHQTLAPSSNVSTTASMLPSAMPDPNNCPQNLERLFSLSQIEVKDELEEKMCRVYLMVQNIIARKSETQIHEELTRKCRESPLVSDEITCGLIVSMLLDFDNPLRLLPIILSHREGSTQLNNYLNLILSEKYLRLHDHARQRLLILCRELLRIPIQNIEAIYYNLLRNIVSGDVSPRNLQLAESIIDILLEHRMSYDNNLPLIQYAVFKYLRVIADLYNSNSQLLPKAVRFCHSLLSERFMDFIPIGRDLLRLLQQICRVPEFDQLWKIILTKPTTLAPQFDLVSIMRLRTHRRFIRLLITSDIEKKISFMVSQVRLGSQRRYQDWFQKQYFNGNQNQMLRADIIRFICNLIHPTNETIASDLVPRWAVIGWLLNNILSPIALAWSRMALFYDWLFFDVYDTTNNSIMDLEPGMLVMFFSAKNYPAITASLLDFLCRISSEFYPLLAQQIKKNIRKAIIYQLEKRVIPNLSFMFDSGKLDLTLRQLISKTFPDLPMENFSLPHMQMTMPGQPPGPSPGYPQQPQPSIGAMVPNGNFLSQVSSTSSSIPTQTTSGPTLIPSDAQMIHPTQTSSTIIYAGQPQQESMVTMIVQSRFSDDEEESSSEHQTNDSQSTKSQSAKLKKSNSFSGNSNIPFKDQSTKSSTNDLKASATTTTSTTFSKLSQTNATTLAVNNTNNPEYIANILNSTVMNNNHNPRTNNHQFPLTSNQNNPVSVIVNNSNKPLITKDSSELSPATNSFMGTSPLKPPEIVTIIEDNDETIPDPHHHLNPLAPFSSTKTTILEQESPVMNSSAQVGDNSNEIKTSYLTPKELAEQIAQITNENINSAVSLLVEKKEQQSQCESLRILMQKLCEENEGDYIPYLTIILSSILDENISQHRLLPFPKSYIDLIQPDKNMLKASIQGPLFVMFETYVEIVKKSPVFTGNVSNVKLLIGELYTNNPRFGFMLLHYLVVTGNTFERMKVYRELVQFTKRGLVNSLMSDLEECCCCQDYFFIFFNLLPTVINTFSTELTNNENIVKLLSFIVSLGDFQTTHFLCTLIERDQLRLVKEDYLADIIASSVNYPSVSQQLLWNILNAHDFQLEYYLFVLTKKQENLINHQMVLGNIIQMSKRVEPTQPFFKSLMMVNRDHSEKPTSEDHFVITILMYWSKKYKEKLAEIIGNYVSSIISSPTKRLKRTLNNVAKNQIPPNKTINVEQLLYYLSEMRKCSKKDNEKDFFSQEFFHVIMDQLLQICSSQQQSNYSELFSVLNDDPNGNNNKNQKKSSVTGNNSSGTNKKVKKVIILSSSDSEASEDSFAVPKKNSKSNLRSKKRKTQSVASDSD